MSYCDCDSDDIRWDFYRSSMQRARKAYQCHECGASVAVGDIYERVIGKWGGDLLTFRTCNLCVEIGQWAKISVPCFCYAHGGLHGAVREMVSDLRRDVPGFLFEWGRRAVRIRQRGGNPA